MLCTQLIPEKTIGMLIAGCQVYNHAFRPEIPCATLLPSQPHCVELIRLSISMGASKISTPARSSSSRVLDSVGVRPFQTICFDTQVGSLLLCRSEATYSYPVFLSWLPSTDRSASMLVAKWCMGTDLGYGNRPLWQRTHPPARRVAAAGGMFSLSCRLRNRRGH